MTLFVIMSLVAVVVFGGNMIITPPINAQENLTSLSQSQNVSTTAATTNTTGTAEEITYILVFGHRIIGNIDNSTTMVYSIVGNDSAKIEEEFVDEISVFTPSQQLQEQINKIVNDGINGLPCGDSLTTEEGENVSVDCISTGEKVIWYVYPATPS